jgi:Ca2+-binding EF-hand superfamily protein
VRPAVTSRGAEAPISQRLVREHGWHAHDAREAEALQQLWAGLDADSSGSLDAEEVRQVLRGMGKELPEGEFQQAMRAIDSDGSGELDFGEFLRWWQTQDAQAQKQLLLMQQVDFSVL